MLENKKGEKRRFYKRLKDGKLDYNHVIFSSFFSGGANSIYGMILRRVRYFDDVDLKATCCQ